MTPRLPSPAADERRARNRYFLLILGQALGSVGAIFGLLLAGRAHQWWNIALGGAIALAGIYVALMLPRALARRWRSPDPVDTEQ